MIVTHAQNEAGQRRVYLGGQGSLHCWIEPKDDASAWSFHLEPAVTGNPLTDDQRREWAVYTLTQLADQLAVAPTDLATVPFECIAALHTADPFATGRIATPRRKATAQNFMNTSPGITRPSADFRSADHPGNRRRA